MLLRIGIELLRNILIILIPIIYIIAGFISGWYAGKACSIDAISCGYHDARVIWNAM